MKAEGRRDQILWGLVGHLQDFGHRANMDAEKG